MRKLMSALLYTALAVVANTAHADMSAVEALREGDMRKLMFHETPVASSDAPFFTESGEEMTLAAYDGQIVVLNFWATWCAPCRKEMPQLNNLQKEFGGDNFEVLTIATGRNSPEGITRFFDEAGIDSLPRHQDPKQALASQMGVFGLPITVIMDPEGREIARLRGDADWNSDSAKAIVSAMISAGS